MAVLRAYSQGLSLPGIQPRGAMQINWSHPISNGLSYVRVFNTGGNVGPLFNVSGYDGAFTALAGSPTIGVAHGGVGFTGVGTVQYGPGGTSNYAAPQTKGTFVAQVSAGFSPTDNLNHKIIELNGFFIVQKYSDNNWYTGWNTGADYRVAVAASGTFSAGDTFSCALTYDTSANTKLYTKGVLRGTNATPPVTALTSASGYFTVGGDLANGSATWNVSDKDAIYYVAFWSRVLSTDEIALLDADPYCFLIPAEGEMPALFVAAAGGSFIPAWAMNSNLPVLGTGTY